MDERFAFGENWSQFLHKITPERIRDAEASLQERLGALSGKSFLDIGSGSGLFSLAARNLGAEVISFDYDEQSVACTEKLRETHRPGDGLWKIFQGSALDTEMLEGLGHFDVVYSWGVLHHTGAMWEAMQNAGERVADSGLLYIAIYNDQGGYSGRWKRLKRFYLSLPQWFRPTFAALVLFFRELKPVLGQIVRLRNPMRYFRSKQMARGMSYWTDWLDWIGGYPFEVAKPEDIFDFYRDRNFELLALTTNRGEAGCNEYVFRKKADQSCVE